MWNLLNRILPVQIFFEGDDGGGAGGGGGGDTGNDGGDDAAAKISAAREAAKAAGTFIIDDWREALPEDLATDGALADFRDWRDVPKSYIHARRSLSRDKLPIPGENASQEEWDAFYNRLGRPEAPENYEFTGPDEPPEGFVYPARLEADFRKWAHADGLTAGQAKKLWSRLTGHMVENFNNTMTQAKTAIGKQWDTLKQDWGTNYKNRAALAKKAFFSINQALGEGNEVPAQALQNPQLLRMYALVGEHMSEDQLGDVKPGSGQTMTRREAMAKIQSYQDDRKGPYWNADHPAHKRVMNEVRELYKIAEPED